LESEKKMLLDFYKEQVGAELAIVRSVNKSLKGVKNVVVTSVLKGIALDSQKHAAFYRALIELETSHPALSEDELNNLKRVVKKHVADEEKALAAFKSTMAKVKDEKAKLLLESILADERRHHLTLKKVLDTIVRGVTITDQEWWDLLWSAVPFHGAPGEERV